MKKLELPNKIETVAEAEAFLDLLQANGLTYHCEDDATDCLEGLVSYEQAKQINVLMGQIYDLPGNESGLNMIFDPCEYIVNKY